MAKQYTNRPELIEQDPESWEAPTGMPLQESPSPIYAPGATESTTSMPGAVPGDPIDQPAQVPPDPRLGMNPQGGWTADKVGAMFPGMIKTDTSDWLDPAEEAKKREGLPYDASKKYDEKKPYPGINVAAIPGAGGPDSRPPILRMSREQWENQIFQKIGGNPALFNPYDEVVKSDRDLPDLFNQVFQGRVQWTDLPKLDKDERAYWEQIKKEHHERVYKEAVAKKQQMSEAYKWMMGNWAYEQKEAAAELSRLDKVQARKDAASGKAPTVREGFDENTGEKILYVWDGDTQSWAPSLGSNGKPVRTAAATLEDFLSPKAKFAAAQLAKLQEGLPEQYKFIESMAEGPDKNRFMAMFSKKLTSEELERKKQLQGLYDMELGKLMSAGVVNKQQAPAAAPGAAAPAALSMDNVLAGLGARAKQNPDDPKVAAGIIKFKSDFATIPGSAARVDNMMRKIREAQGIGVPPLSNAPAETGKPVAAQAPVPAVGKAKPEFKDKASFVRQANDYVTHLTQDATTGAWRALDYIGEEIIKEAKRFDVHLGKVLRGQ